MDEVEFTAYCTDANKSAAILAADGAALFDVGINESGTGPATHWISSGKTTRARRDAMEASIYITVHQTINWRSVLTLIGMKRTAG